jgi:hypothetical protein
MGRPPKYTSLEERQEARRNQCRLNQRAWRARVAAVKDEDGTSSKADKEGSQSSSDSPVPPPALTTQSSSDSASSLPTPPIATVSKRNRHLLPLLHARELRPLLYSTSPIGNTPSEIPGSTSLELRSLDYYRSVVLGRLEEAFPSPIWGDVILPASYTNSAIMHAIAGYSQAHEHGSRSLPVAVENVARKSLSQSPAPSDKSSSAMQDVTDEASSRRPRAPRSAFELSQINKAIRALLIEQAKESPDGTIDDSRLEMVLTVCLIFVFQEIMCEDYDAALIHLDHGIDLIIRWRERRQTKKFTNKNSETLLALLSMLQRVDLVASCWGKGHKMKLVAKEEELDIDYPPFHSLYQAGNRLYRILHHFFAVESAKGTNKFSRTDPVVAKTTPLTSETIAMLRRERAKVIEYFTRWQSTFNNFVCRRQLPALILTPPSSRSASATPLPFPSPPLSSGKPHTFLTVFKAAISCARAHNELCARSTPTGKSWIDMSSIAPLYFTAMQCPDQVERDESLKSLKDLVKQECFWHDETAFTWSAGQAVDVG